MKTEPEHPIDFKAWRDIEPPPDFTANVLRRIRTQPEERPSLRYWLSAWLETRIGYAAALAASVVAAVLVWHGTASGPAELSLEHRSLLTAYTQAFAGGG